MENVSTVIVLGDGTWGADEGNTPVISPYSFERAQAAAILYLNGVGSRYIFCGGKTAGKDFPSEAELLEDSFIKELRSKGNENGPEVLVEEESLDTHENFKNIKSLLGNGVEDLGVLTSEWHLYRAAMIARAVFQTPLQKFAAEKILRQQNPSFKGFFKENLHQELPKKIIREAILISLLSVDPHGRIPRILTSRRGRNLNIQL